MQPNRRANMRGGPQWRREGPPSGVGLFVQAMPSCAAWVEQACVGARPPWSLLFCLPLAISCFFAARYSYLCCCLLEPCAAHGLSVHARAACLLLAVRQLGFPVVLTLLLPCWGMRLYRARRRDALTWPSGLLHVLHARHGKGPGCRPAASWHFAGTPRQAEGQAGLIWSRVSKNKVCGREPGN